MNPFLALKERRAEDAARIRRLAAENERLRQALAAANQAAESARSSLRAAFGLATWGGQKRLEPPSGSGRAKP